MLMAGSVFPALSPVMAEIPGACCLLEEMGFGTTIWALDITGLATVSGLFFSGQSTKWSLLVRLHMS